MEALHLLSRSEMKNIKGGVMNEGCYAHPVTTTINGDCQGSLYCDGEQIQIACCSDFGQDVGWCH